jgi:hypothetical protein
MLVHVEDFLFAKQLGDGDVIDVIRARPDHLAYITKQRLPFSPEVEATHWHRRQAGEKIAGARLSFNADAKALIAAQRSRQSARVSPLPLKVAYGEARYMKKGREGVPNNAGRPVAQHVPELVRAS